jgi:hypothetical protein
MAHVLGFPKDVTDLISGMRDWRWEMVRDGGKTPSARCFDARPQSCNYIGDQPRVWAYGLPEVYIESVEEACDFGEVYNTDQCLAFLNDVKVKVHDQGAMRFWSINLRDNGGHAPVKFRRLQKRHDRRIKEMWWQCEPCGSNVE